MFANLFKTAMLASAVVVPSVVLAAPQQALAEKSNFQFYNNSSETIYYVYIGESSLPTWGDDLLGNQILPPGSSFQVIFGNMDPNVCMYDFRAELESGEYLEEYQINVCSNDYFEVFDQ